MNKTSCITDNCIIPSDEYVIEFDGGTSCNIPSKGYGEGYGSFQINGGEIKRVEFGVGHSCNSAEILTLCAALNELKYVCPYAKEVLCRGDSQIALKWISYQGKPSKKSSPMFLDAINLLRKAVGQFSSVRPEWRNRNHSVALFGH